MGQASGHFEGPPGAGGPPVLEEKFRGSRARADAEGQSEGLRKHSGFCQGTLGFDTFQIKKLRILKKDCRFSTNWESIDILARVGAPGRNMPSFADPNETLYPPTVRLAKYFRTASQTDNFDYLGCSIRTSIRTGQGNDVPRVSASTWLGSASPSHGSDAPRDSASTWLGMEPRTAKTNASPGMKLTSVSDDASVFPFVCSDSAQRDGRYLSDRYLLTLSDLVPDATQKESVFTQRPSLLRPRRTAALRRRMQRKAARERDNQFTSVQTETDGDDVSTSAQGSSLGSRCNMPSSADRNETLYPPTVRLAKYFRTASQTDNFDYLGCSMNKSIRIGKGNDVPRISASTWLGSASPGHSSDVPRDSASTWLGIEPRTAKTNACLCAGLCAGLRAHQVRCYPPQIVMADAAQEMRDGDWICPSCSDHQFVRNAACRKCGTANPAGPPDTSACKWCQLGECWTQGQVNLRFHGPVAQREVPTGQRAVVHTETFAFTAPSHCDIAASDAEGGREGAR